MSTAASKKAACASTIGGSYLTIKVDTLCSAILFLACHPEYKMQNKHAVACKTNTDYTQQLLALLCC